MSPIANGRIPPRGEEKAMDTAAYSLADIAGSRFPLLEYAPDATVIVDPHGTVRLVNAQTERLFGYYREELLGQRVERLIARYHGNQFEERSIYFADPQVLPMGVGRELYGRHKDGSEFPVEISLSPLSTTEGTFVAIAIRDVTERIATQQRLQELNAQLENANRAKDHFLASMSHELRTPLNAVLGFTGTLLMRLPGPLTNEQERQLQIVRSSATHLLSLINDILDLSKIESGKRDLSFEPVRVEEVIAEVYAALSSSAHDKGLAFTACAGARPSELVTDRRALHQILLNLANNAIKYTQTGSVRIDTALATWQGSSALEIGITDTGVGIKESDLKRLFEAFEQLDPTSTRRFEGTGLGLYLSRSLTLLLGGSLNVVSEYGAGSTFTLTLPLVGRPS